MIEVSYYNRLEPRPRTNDFAASLAAEIRDPLWFLARQWQLGEFSGEDAGSLAYVEYSGRTTKFPRWKLDPAIVPTSSPQSLDEHVPLEKQTLREPIAPDAGTQVELGHDFADLLRDQTSNAAALLTAFGTLERFKIAGPPPVADEDPLNPMDAASRRFLRVCAGRVLNGYELLKLGKGIAAGGEQVPPDVTTNAGEIAAIEAALAELVARAEEVFGGVGTADPATWSPSRLEYRLQVIGADPAGAGNVTLQAYPGSDGEFDWFSFDVIGRDSSAGEEAPTPRSDSIIPARVRFPGMAASRFWAFEEQTLAIPDILATGTDDLLKLLIADFMLIHSNDWFVLPFEQPVGSLAQIDYLLVHDVFGTQVAVLRADLAETKAGTNRWTMFSNTDASSGDDALADYFVLPPNPGVALTLGSVLEDVRFGRDETANMAWGIEYLTSSEIGEPRKGSARDADVDLARNLKNVPNGSGFPLRYEVESDVPTNWVPLLPRLKFPNASPPNPSIVLQRGKLEKAIDQDTTGPVPSLSKILNPELPSDTPYLIEEEEIARAGLRIERVVYRSRWTDGSTHLWVQRRRRIGAGESQSGLEFDQPLPNDG
jgi:hypothetical protein